MFEKLITYFLDLPIIQKLSFFYTFIVIVIVIIVYAYFPQNSRRQQVQMMTRRVELASELTIPFLIHTFQSKDLVLLKKIVEPLKLSKEIDFYLIADGNGKIIESDRSDLIKKYIKNIRSDTIYTTNDDKYIVKIKPVYKNQKIVLYLTHGISLLQVNNYISKLKLTIFYIVIVVLIAGLSSIILFTNYIFKPLNELKRNIQEVSDGNYSSRIKVFGNDEIGLLTKNFNQMAENLEITRQKLKYEITQRENTEEELLFAQKSLYESLEKQKELNLLKSKFISMISHEYRTPLTSISNSSYLLEQYAKKGDQHGVEKFSSMIKSSVNRMTKLLEDVLSVSQEEKLKMDLKLVNVNLNDFCNDISEEFKILSHFKHNFTFDFDNINITIESKLFQLIVKNLISNAIKYSPANTEIYFSTKLIDNLLVIIIKDFGIGIKPHDIENLYVPFHRGDNVGALEGTGLGMAIIKESVELLLGEINLESNTGENSFTKFTISFPIVNNSMIINPNA